MGKRLFGTDGIRGRAGTFPLDNTTIERIGRALVEDLKRRGRPGRLAVGYDTRESSESICAALARGVHRAGGEVAVAGVIPTPGVAFITRADRFDAGVVISASHNPFHDNGIKVFQSDGTKLPDEDEAWIESHLLDGPETEPESTGDKGRAVAVDSRLMEDYLDFLVSCVRGRVDLNGVRVVVDCANGASSVVAPRLMERLGVDAIFRACSPDGRNINKDCGSLHPDSLKEQVRETGADLGLAFDGDADRCLAVDDAGRVLDGDFILFVTAAELRRRGRLRNDTVVATVMTNLWLEERLGESGIRLLRTPVGDKYVLEEMVRGDHVLGGEQSGHVIFREHATTGDGLLTGLMLMAAWRADGRRLSHIVADVTPCPQVLVNVEVRSKPDLDTHAELGPLLQAATRSMNGRGRLLVRYSGTEPLARVMAEGRDADEIRRIAGEVADALRAHLA